MLWGGRRAAAGAGRFIICIGRGQAEFAAAAASRRLKNGAQGDEREEGCGRGERGGGEWEENVAHTRPFGVTRTAK